MIRAQTQARTPVSACCTQGFSAKDQKKAEMMVTMIMGGTSTPRVARRDPDRPWTRYPQKVAVFTAMGPGVLSLTAKMSKMSLSSIQPSRRAISRRIRGIMA